MCALYYYDFIIWYYRNILANVFIRASKFPRDNKRGTLSRRSRNQMLFHRCSTRKKETDYARRDSLTRLPVLSVRLYIVDALVRIVAFRMRHFAEGSRHRCVSRNLCLSSKILISVLRMHVNHKRKKEVFSIFKLNVKYKFAPNFPFFFFIIS